MPQNNFNEWIKKELRRIAYKWKPRKECYVNARVSRGKYRCAYCGELFGPKDIQIDHIIPVIDPHQGFVDWDTYIERLFSPLENYQVLCKPCHTIKTNAENKIRRQQK